MSATDYFMRLTTLRDNLETYLQLPTCKCVKEFNLSKLQELEKEHQFMMGLYSNNANISKDPNLNILIAKNWVTKEVNGTS